MITSSIKLGVIRSMGWFEGREGHKGWNDKVVIGSASPTNINTLTTNICCDSTQCNVLFKKLAPCFTIGIAI
jgi:hypothetical protein